MPYYKHEQTKGDKMKTYEEFNNEPMTIKQVLMVTVIMPATLTLTAFIVSPVVETIGGGLVDGVAQGMGYEVSK